MSTIYIHIGSHKTGTSSLQKYLSEMASDIGIHYPVSGRVNGTMHHALAYEILGEMGDDISGFFFGPNKFGETWANLREELTGIPKDIPVVVSSEEFFRLSQRKGVAALQSLKDKLSGIGDVKVVLYLRRQDLFYESSYNQNVKFTKWTGDFCDQMKSLDTIRSTYLQVIDSWATVFGAGNIIIRPFEKSSLHKGNLIEDFSRHLGLSYLPSSSDLNENERLPNEVVELKRFINHVPYHFPKYRDSINKLIARLDYFSFGKSFYQMPKGYYEKMLPIWRSVNEEVEIRYLSGNKFFIEDFPPIDSISFSDDCPERFKKNLTLLCESALGSRILAIDSDMYTRAITIKGCLLLCAFYNLKPDIDFSVLSKVINDAEFKMIRDLAFFENQMNLYKNRFDGL